ncbi:hypothetical protein D3C72_2064020 [compost metagenome]
MQMSRQYSFDLDLSPQTTCATIRENLIFHTPTIISRFAHDLGVSNVPEILRGHVAASADQSAQRIADEFLRALEV